MGDHRNNPRAIEKAIRQALPSMPAGTELYGYQQRCELMLNAETMEEVVMAGQAAKLAGESQRDAVTQATKEYDPMHHPEKFDLVVFNVLTLARPSPLIHDPNKIPQAIIRHSEVLRIPLVDLKKRADEAFGMASRGDTEPS